MIAMCGLMIEYYLYLLRVCVCLDGGYARGG